MACKCESLRKKLDKLQKKHSRLRKNHKKLLGVTVLLTEALEHIIKGDENTEITETLESCFTIYPDLIEKSEQENMETETETVKNETDSGQIVDENGKGCEPVTESEREYYEGFWSRPRIPRTPQV